MSEFAAELIAALNRRHDIEREEREWQLAHPVVFRLSAPDDDDDEGPYDGIRGALENAIDKE